MNRQGSHSFTIDALMSPAVGSRIGQSVYNSGYVFMPPAGNLNLLRGLGGYTSTENMLSSAMMHYAQAPFQPFPLMAPTSGLYPGHLHSAFSNTAFHGIPTRCPTATLAPLEQSEKLVKRPGFECSPPNEGADASHPTDLRITANRTKDDTDDVQEIQISNDEADDQRSDISIEGNTDRA